MKTRVLLIAAAAGAVALAGCRNPELAGRKLSAEESEFQLYVQQCYPGWEPRQTLPSGVRSAGELEEDYVEIGDVGVLDDGGVVADEGVKYTEYIVQKNDTLSKISKKVYGNGRKYYRIQKANADVLKDPNKLKAGMKLRIPAL